MMYLRLCFMMVFVLSGCGQKGALYIATSEQKAEIAARDARVQQKKMDKVQKNRAAKNAKETVNLH